MFVVRYTGFFLLVGIGVGLSSYVIYKIFGRFRKSKRRDESGNRTDKYVSRKSLDLEVLNSLETASIIIALSLTDVKFD